MCVSQIVFVPGGHGIAFDGPGNKKLAAVLTEAYAAGKHVLLSACEQVKCRMLNHVSSMARAPV